MNPVLRRWLANSPLLLTAYFRWDNRRRRAPRRHAAAYLLLCAAALAAVAWTSRLPWPASHRILLACLCALAACVLTARRRGAARARAARSWAAALPATPTTALWSRIAIELTPACACIALLLAGAPLPIAAAMSGGIVAGVLVSYAAPSRTAEVLPPGSRYVPQRRTSRDILVRGSLSALGAWPVRQMFASARPKEVSRAVLPVLLMMPLGASADYAMLIVGMLGIVGAFALLLSSLLAVNRQASSWLRPSPLNAGVLRRHLLARSLLVMLAMVLTEAWLYWVMRSSPR